MKLEHFELKKVRVCNEKKHMQAAFVWTYLTLSLFLISSCSTTTIKPVAPYNESSFGPAPKDPRQMILQHLKNTLKDPGSLQVQNIGQPSRSTAYVSKEIPHGYDNYSDVEYTPIYGWKVCATYNAKNSYGGYVGFKTATYFFEKGTNFHVPLVITKELMEGPHRTGETASGLIFTLAPCASGV